MDALLRVLCESSVRAVIIVVAVIIVLRALRVKSPTVLHRAWTAVLISMLLLPALSFWTPILVLPILPPAAAQRGAHIRPTSSVFSASVEFERDGVAGAPDLLTQGQPSRQVRGRASRLGRNEIAVLLYLTGVAILLARLVVGMVLAARLVRGASPHGQLFHSTRCRAPLSVGLFRPRILLPEPAKSWDQAKLDAVFAHEQAHVRRRDPLVEWLAMLNRSFYWFHPLAWWLRRRLAVLAEQACDEAVLAQGHDPAGYAALLLELARSVKRGGTLVSVSGSAIDGSTLAVRIRRILTAGRSPALSRMRMVIITALCAGAIAVPALATLARTRATPALQPMTGEFVPPAAGAMIRQSIPLKMQPEPRAAGAVLPAAGQKTAPVRDTLPADGTLLQTGLDLLERGQHKDARLAFMQLIRSYPGSSLEPDAYFALGDAFRSQGGKENLMLAEDQYRNFIIFFPQNPKAQDAQLKIISILMRQTQDPERDQKKEMIRAEAEIRKFIKWFPTSEYVPIVEKYKEEIARKLLESDLNPAGAAPEKSPESIQANMLTDTYRRWLQEEAVYIISKEERNAFLSLTTDEERAMFIDQFWARRNPDPRASSNSAKLEHYRRIAYANEHFTCAIAGWKTDRGRIYILFGESEGKESHPSAGALPREAWEGGGETGAYPYELWRYDRHAGVGSTVFMFVDRFKDGSFPLLAAKSPEGQSLQAGALTLASSVVSAPPVFDGIRFRQGTLKVVPKGTPEYTNGQTLIPYLEIYDVAVDRATGKPTLLISFIIKLGNRVVAHIEDAEARTCQWSEKGLAIVGSIPLKDMEPGNYLLMIRVQDRITERTLETAADFSIIRSPVRSPAPD